MAYTTDELEGMALKVIKEKGLVFIDEVCVFMPISRATFYNHGLDKFDTIRDAINGKKISIKHQIREDWRDGNPTEKVALYKILGNEDERSALNGNNQNNQVSGEMKLIIERKTITGRENG